MFLGKRPSRDEQRLRFLLLKRGLMLRLSQGETALLQAGVDGAAEINGEPGRDGDVPPQRHLTRRLTGIAVLKSGGQIGPALIARGFVGERCGALVFSEDLERRILSQGGPNAVFVRQRRKALYGGQDKRPLVQLKDLRKSALVAFQIGLRGVSRARQVGQADFDLDRIKGWRAADGVARQRGLLDAMKF